MGVEDEDALGIEIFVGGGEVLEHLRTRAQGPVGEVLGTAYVRCPVARRAHVRLMQQRA